MRVSVVKWAPDRCCNTANSSLTIDGKFEILNKLKENGINAKKNETLKNIATENDMAAKDIYELIK